MVAKRKLDLPLTSWRMLSEFNEIGALLNSLNLDEIAMTYLDRKFGGKLEQVMLARYDLVENHGLTYDKLSCNGRTDKSPLHIYMHYRVARDAGPCIHGSFLYDAVKCGMDPAVSSLLQSHETTWGFRYSYNCAIPQAVVAGEPIEPLSGPNNHVVIANTELIERCFLYSGYVLEISRDYTFRRYCKAQFGNHVVTDSFAFVPVVLASISPEWGAYNHCKSLKVTDRVWENIGRVKSVDADIKRLLLQMAMAEKHHRKEGAAVSYYEGQCQIVKGPST
jgi:hypothetical protein